MPYVRLTRGIRAFLIEQGIAVRTGSRAETRTAMQQLGAPSLKELTPGMVRRV